MERAGTHFGIERLDQHAALIRPITVEDLDDVLEGRSWHAPAHEVACEKRASIAVDILHGFDPMASVTPVSASTKPDVASVLGLHRRLDLDETLAALLADGLLSDPDIKRVRADARTASGRSELHPLVLVANLKLADARKPDKPLSLEGLTEWLAHRAGLPYVKIDPMKIDVGAVSQVVSHAYANRYRILPIAVS